MEPLVELSPDAEARIKAKECKAEEQYGLKRNAYENDEANACLELVGYLRQEQLRDAVRTARAGVAEAAIVVAKCVFAAHATEYRIVLRDPRKLEPVLATLREAVITQYGPHTQPAVQACEAVIMALVEKWETFFRSAQECLALLTQERVHKNPRRFFSRLDTLAEEALELLFRDKEDLDSWKQVLKRLAEFTLAAIGVDVSESVRAQISEQQRQWEQIAKSCAEDANLPERRWHIGSRDEPTRQKRGERFERLAAHAADVELRVTFAHRSAAVDAWLDLLHKESPCALEPRIKALCTASADYLAELKIRAVKAGDRAKADLLNEIGQQFRELADATADQRTDLYAIYRGVEWSTVEGTKNQEASMPSQTATGHAEVVAIGYCSRLAERSEARFGSAAKSDYQKVQIHGPDEAEFIISPAGDYCMWSVLNEGSGIEQLRVELCTIQTFNAKKLAFRKPVNLPYRWPLLKDIEEGSLTKSVILLRIDGDNLRLHNSDATPVLTWPSGDQTPLRRWCLNLKITGLSKEWPIDLLVQWMLGAKTIDLMQYSDAKGITNAHMAAPLPVADSGPTTAGRPDGIAVGAIPINPPSRFEIEKLGKASNRKGAKKRGRRSNPERRVAIRRAIEKHGASWRDHLDEIFTELDSAEVFLGDFQGMKIDLGDGESTKVTTWGDLDLAKGEQRRQILDTLRKYAD